MTEGEHNGTVYLDRIGRESKSHALGRVLGGQWRWNVGWGRWEDTDGRYVQYTSSLFDDLGSLPPDLYLYGDDRVLGVVFYGWNGDVSLFGEAQ